MANDICDRHETNPDPNNGACCVTNLAEPGVTFRGLEPSNWHWNQLFLGETALNEAIAELYGLTVNEARIRLTDDEKSMRAQIKRQKAEIAVLTRKVEFWADFKQKAADAGLVIDL